MKETVISMDIYWYKILKRAIAATSLLMSGMISCELWPQDVKKENSCTVNETNEEFNMNNKDLNW